MIIAECHQGCNNTQITNYHFSIYKQWSFGANDFEEKWVECLRNKTGILTFTNSFYKF
jgi:hypothetical protein